ncbi:hypothetical protein K2X92_05230 [Candidatus Gracilibacteria bacterium]|nr:hypothetical protein [Candidatus Gracilibacteria bacterium]
MQKILLFCFLFSIGITNAIAANDALELAITPIRTSINASLSGATNGTVTLYNNSDETHSFSLSIEDCTAGAINGTPICKPYTYPGINPNSLASWVTFDTSGVFSIAARGKRTITYSIAPPINAIPGGHYGAIFFNNQTTNTNTSISMNRRIGSLLLVTIPGDIIVAPEFGEIKITGAGGGISGITNPILDFFSPSQTGSIIEKGKKLLMVFTDPIIRSDIIDFINPFWDTPELPTNTGSKFVINTDLPISNKGTIHISPEGKITIHEEDGKQLLGIGKELVINDNGAIVGEKIVDYLIINEENGNVLPGTTRVFKMSWEGFAQEYFTSSGKIAIRFESPGIYYSRILKENQSFLYPWEKLAVTHTTKKLTAKIDLSYIDPITNERVPQNSEIPLHIEFDEVTKTWNTGLFFIVGIYLLWFFIKKRRRNENKHHHGKNKTPLYNEEIHALENAYSLLGKKGNKLKKISGEQTLKVFSGILGKSKKEKKSEELNKAKASVKKITPVAKKTVEKNVVAPVKKETPIRKPVTKKVAVTTTKSVDKKTPVKKVVPVTKNVIKKPVAKKTVEKKVVAPVKKETPIRKPVTKKVAEIEKTEHKKHKKHK